MPEQRPDTPDDRLHLNIANQLLYTNWLKASQAYIRNPSATNLTRMLRGYAELYSYEGTSLSENDLVTLERFTALVSDLALVSEAD